MITEYCIACNIQAAILIMAAYPGNANLPIGDLEEANREIDGPGSAYKAIITIADIQVKPVDIPWKYNKLAVTSVAKLNNEELRTNNK